MAYTLTPIPKFQPLVGGAYLPSGKLYTYLSGTSTPAAVYQDTSGTAHPNPVILDAEGSATIYLDSTKKYKFVLKDSSDVTKWTVDPVNSANYDNDLRTDLANTSDTAKGDALVSGKRTLAGANAFTLHKYFEYDMINVVTDFGADNTGATDATTAIQAAIDAAEADVNKVRALYFPSGIYACNSLNWAGYVPFIGESVGNYGARLRYNGAGSGGGTHILDITRTATTSTPMIVNMEFDGWDGTLNGQVCENLIKNSGNNSIDLHFHFSRCTFKRCWGDAVDVSNSDGVINWHIERIRFDWVGGFGVKLQGASSNERRPVTISKFSYDNNIYPADFGTTVQTLGHYNGTNWGKGLVHIYDPRGINLKLVDGRIECNKNLIDCVAGEKAIVYCESVATGNVGAVVADFVVGFMKNSDAAVFVYDPGDHVTYRESFVSVADFAKRYKSGTERRDVLGTNVTEGVSIGGSQGINNLDPITLITRGTSIEARDAQSETAFGYYRFGDVRLHRDPALGEAALWVCTAPTTGHAYGFAKTITSGAVVTAASATVNLSGDTAALKHMSPGFHIKLGGAGAASADLDTYVTAVDADAQTITVNDTPSTSVNPCTITAITPTWTQVSQVGYRSNAGSPSGALTPKHIGERVFDSTNSLWYIATGTANTAWKLVTERSYQTNAGVPVGSVTPNYTGELLLDTTNSVWYKSISTTSASWRRISQRVNEIEGYFNAAATTSHLASGWSVAKNSTGNYTVTHNLGLSTPYHQYFYVTGNAVGALDTDSTVLTIYNVGANSFQVLTKTNASGSADSDVIFHARWYT